MNNDFILKKSIVQLRQYKSSIEKQLLGAEKYLEKIKNRYAFIVALEKERNNIKARRDRNNQNPKAHTYQNRGL